MSLVSVIVPTHNRAPLIRETLDSVAAQTHAPIELIVADDGSSDGTAAVVRAWIAGTTLQRALYLPFAENRGKAVVVNDALQRSTGEYLWILDSDDVLLPHAVATLARFLDDHPEVGMVSAMAYAMIGERRTDTVISVLHRWPELLDVERTHGSLLLRGNSVLSSTALLRRRVVETVGPLDPALRYVHDWDYWIRVGQRFPLGFVGVPVLYYRTGVSGASSRNRLGTYRESAQLLMRALPAHPRPAVLRALLFQARSQAALAFQDGDPAQSARILAEGAAAVLRAAVA